jgi:hypothetical protein
MYALIPLAPSRRKRRGHGTPCPQVEPRPGRRVGEAFAARLCPYRTRLCLTHDGPDDTTELVDVGLNMPLLVEEKPGAECAVLHVGICLEPMTTRRETPTRSERRRQGVRGLASSACREVSGSGFMISNYLFEGYEIYGLHKEVTK